jgi:hypothetical protein
MLKKYFLIGILVITVALVISAFTWVSISRTGGSQVVQAQGLASLNAADASAYRYTAMAKFYSQAKNIAVTGFRTPPMSNFSGISSIASTGFRTPPMTSFVPSAQLSVTEHLAALKAGSGLAVDGKLVDDRYISPSSSYLVDGKLIDDRYSAPSNPYLALASQYREHISPSLSSSYRYVRSAQLSVTERLAILKAGPGLIVVSQFHDR